MRGKPSIFSGDTVNCAIWIPDGYGGWKCGKFGRPCETEPPGQCAPIGGKSKQVKVCIAVKKVHSKHYKKSIIRCGKYAPACSGSACIDFSLPYPGGASEITRPSPKGIRSRAAWLAEQYNVEKFSKEPYLAREILERGGIRPYRRGAEAEEYKTIPLFLRNKGGMPLDEVASEMGYEYTNDLMEAIWKAYPPKAKGQWRRERRKTAADFIDAAYDDLQEEIDLETDRRAADEAIPF